MKMTTGIGLIVFLFGCSPGTSQQSLTIIRSPHEARSVRLLNELWRPGCFKVYIVRTDDLSLLAGTGSGRILINEQFAISVALDDNVLRAVLAHEIAHALLGHDQKLRVAADNFMEGATRFASMAEKYITSGDIGVATKLYRDFLPLLSPYLSALIGQEFEADALAIEILREKGFDPQAYVVALESLPADVVDSIEKQSVAFLQEVQEMTERFRTLASHVASPIPTYPTRRDRVAAARQKLLSREEKGALKTSDCPVWPSDDELIAQATRDKKREEELAARVNNLERAVEKAEQALLKMPLDKQYRYARSLALKSDSTALFYLSGIVKQDPRYKDTLTLLGRAYYSQGRYDDAHAILQRAVALKNDDEIAWLVFGLTQIRLGDEAKGLDSIKGGLTLFSKVSKSGYRGFPDWDQKGVVRNALRMVAFRILNEGLAGKGKIIEDCELLLRSIDDEEMAQLR